MRRYCDLHAHSNVSDGSMSPTELIELAERKRLAGIALTDHDTVAGIPAAASAAAKYSNLTFIPGIEISAEFPHGTLHILGLCIDPVDKLLLAMLENLQQARQERNPKMVKKLQQLGLEVTLEELYAIAGAEREDSHHVIGRAHLAALLVRKGYVSNFNQAFAKYLGKGTAAYVEKDRLAPADAIQAIHSSGGVAILAHPPQLKYDNFAQCERIIRSLQSAGLDGIEAYHSDNSDVEVRFFLKLAKQLGMIISGGSDFHGSLKQDVRLGRPDVPVDVMHALLARTARSR